MLGENHLIRAQINFNVYLGGKMNERMVENKKGIKKFLFLFSVLVRGYEN